MIRRLYLRHNRAERSFQRVNEVTAFELVATPRLQEWLRLIADQLFVSIKTVETYRARLMSKLNLKGRAALVRYALKRGLLDNALASSQD